MIIIHQCHNNLFQTSKIASVIIEIYKRTKDSLHQNDVIVKIIFPILLPTKARTV